MTVSLTNYPLVKIDEYFSVQIDSCLLNSLTLDAGTAYPYTSISPLTFSLHKFVSKNEPLPTYT